ncbi:MAG TPA: gliding motility protein GldL [Saprospiraceae bacterium]|nr:gliding motility protein GldL [Saprospiraceae bacterium]HQW55086.1 gliding motility protein GldL [Saprospiraceae bacterium]
MSFIKSNGFKYLKNLLIGVGASIVMLGALGKIQSFSWGGPALTVGLVTEAIIFLILGLLPPEKDYYWDKLYPGIGDYNASINPITDGPSTPGVSMARHIDADMVEGKMGSMLSELQVMSKSLSSLKALQEVDFSKTQEQVKSMTNFYTRLNDAMASMADSLDDAKLYKEQMVNLNKNLGALNSVYSNMLNAMSSGGHKA